MNGKSTLHDMYNRVQRTATIPYTGQPAACCHSPTHSSSVPHQPSLFLMHLICIPADMVFLNLGYLRMSHNVEHVAATYWTEPGMVPDNVPTLCHQDITLSSTNVLGGTYSCPSTLADGLWAVGWTHPIQCSRFTHI